LQRIRGLRTYILFIDDFVSIPVTARRTLLVGPATVLIDAVSTAISKPWPDPGVHVITVAFGFAQTVSVLVYLSAGKVSPITVLIDSIITGL
tara:strand:- start:215 stop:490 length:276 start_codon:yes stop_codon:yes gene_type:complete